METKSVEDVKAIVAALNLLMGMRGVYTKDVVAGAIQQLVDMSPLPPLMMRTVIQALSLFPALSGFVLNVLQRLVVKQVWKHGKVWEGFVRCCQKLVPMSFHMILQLPAPQLQQVFSLCPEIRLPLLQHVKSLSAHQQAHIPENIMEILESQSSVRPERGGEGGKREGEEEVTEHSSVDSTTAEDTTADSTDDHDS